jgi:DNA-binding CsgD family transcriptional regulator
MSEAEDRAEILALIHANRIGIWTKNYEMWSNCFVHADYTTRWGFNVRGGTFVRRGWDNISQRAQPIFDGGVMPYSEDFAYKTTVENLVLHIEGRMAWAVFEQLYPGNGFVDHIGAGLTHELRVFERVDGRWKIAVLGFLDNNGGRERAPLLKLDAEGAVLWCSEEAEARLADDDDLVVRNGRLRVRDAACQKRLTAALAWAANLDSGYNPSHGSMPLVLGAGEGMPTRVWWVKVEGGEIYFAFDRQSMTAPRLDIAAAIFGLSEGQRRLAGLIADGQSLPEAAAQMGISANTAKTHLQRIYDKTGVHNQAALVRVLLSVGAPA